MYLSKGADERFRHIGKLRWNLVELEPESETLPCRPRIALKAAVTGKDWDHETRCEAHSTLQQSRPSLIGTERGLTQRCVRLRSFVWLVTDNPSALNPQLLKRKRSLRHSNEPSGIKYLTL